MVGVRYSARGPWALAVRGLVIFASGVADICLPDTGLLAERSPVRNNDASKSRVRVQGGGQVGRAHAAAYSDNRTPLSLDDPLSGPCAGRGKLRRLPTGGEADACSIRGTACL